MMSERRSCLARFSRAKNMGEWRMVTASALMILDTRKRWKLGPATNTLLDFCSPTKEGNASREIGWESIYFLIDWKKKKQVTVERLVSKQQTPQTCRSSRR